MRAFIIARKKTINSLGGGGSFQSREINIKPAEWHVKSRATNAYAKSREISYGGVKCPV